jgi:hypothetical protein
MQRTNRSGFKGARWLSWIVLQQRDLAPERHPAMYAELGVFTIYGVR